MYISSNLDFLRQEIVGLSPNIQDRGPPIFGCPGLPTRFIDNCLAYLLAVFLIRNMQTIHAEVQSACQKGAEQRNASGVYIWALCCF
jgi:hypothetical protein